MTPPRSTSSAKNRSKPARGRARKRVLAATGHALAFTTWRSLVREQGLNDEQAADLMCRLVAATASRADTHAAVQDGHHPTG